MKKIYILFCLLVFSASLSFAQTLTSDEIVQKYIAAIGGIDELKKMNQLTLTGLANSGGNAYDLFAYEDFAGKFQYAHVSGPGYDVKTYYDTKQGWTIQNGSKSSLSSETLEQFQPMIEDGTYFYLADMEGRGIKTELMGEAKVNDKDTYKVKFTRNGKDKNIQYFDKETFYLLKMETPSVYGIEIYYSNYKEVPGTKLVFPYYNEKGGIKAIVYKYEINMPIDSNALILDK
jgi:outer membrane lipoprotein-sorting protein